jgi:hypothetical protein
MASGATIGATAGATAAASAAAAARAACLREEEEDMTAYSDADLEEWEFKIVRAHTRYFKDPAQLRLVCEEEGRAGWELVEKFDDYRLRFKRRTEMRKKDQYLDIDPYRSQIGADQTRIVLVAISVALALGLLVFLLISFSGR